MLPITVFFFWERNLQIDSPYSREHHKKGCWYGVGRHDCITFSHSVIYLMTKIGGDMVKNVSDVNRNNCR
jgi:hypothetical protein